MKKLIKNYTTSVPVERTIAEIQTLLVGNGASGIAHDYQEGRLVALYFKINIKDRELPFKLPVKTDQVYLALFSDKSLEWKYKEQRSKQAEQVAWRICKSWLEAQITLVNLKQAKIEEVFLPYLVMPNNQTLFENMKQNNFMLPSGD